MHVVALRLALHGRSFDQQEEQLGEDLDQLAHDRGREWGALGERR
jgi:hypothetical protein